MQIKNKSKIMGMGDKTLKCKHNAVRNCAVHLAAHYGGKRRLLKKTEHMFQMSYDPELDTSLE